MNKEKIIAMARRAISLQADSVRGLEVFVNEDFVKAAELLARSSGRLIVSGIGKSAIIAQKVAATLNSTGTPSIFMHAADAIHGDLGIIQRDDVVMIISKSGSSPEIKVLAPLVRQMGNTLIALVGDTSSYLATHCDIVLISTVEKEACPNNLAPTTSTTAQMVMGDALAVCLMEMKGFRSDDFAKYHPGGALGKKLFLRVSDVISMNAKPAVKPETPVKDVIVEITRNRLGAVAVLDNDDHIAGIITDGDIRRMMERFDSISGLRAADIMGTSPRTIGTEAMAVEALGLMRQNNISQLLVTGEDRYEGIIHLHDLLREGIL